MKLKSKSLYFTVFLYIITSCSTKHDTLEVKNINKKEYTENTNSETKPTSRKKRQNKPKSLSTTKHRIYPGRNPNSVTNELLKIKKTLLKSFLQKVYTNCEQYFPLDNLIFTKEEIVSLRNSIKNIGLNKLKYALETTDLSFGNLIETKYINSHIKYGIFAKDFIPINTVLGIYIGEIQNLETYTGDRMWDLCCSSSKDKVQLGVDATKETILQFVNSSPIKSEINVKDEYVTIGGIPIIIYVANKDIVAENELFVSYGEDYWEARKPLTFLKQREIESDLYPSHLKSLKQIRELGYKYTNKIIVPENLLYKYNALTKASKPTRNTSYPYCSVFKDLHMKFNKKTHLISVLANEDIREGSSVAEYTGELVELNKGIVTTYICALNNRLGVNAASHGNISAYIPGSTDQDGNLDIRIENGQVIYYAIRNIQKDEELVVNHEWA